MSGKFGAFFVCFLIPLRLFSQMQPAEGAKLHYRMITFSVPRSPKADKYKVEVAAGNYNAEALFDKNIVVSASGNTGTIIVTVPSFGKEYTWQMVYTGKSKTTKSGLYHFTTGSVPETDTTLVRLRLINPATEKYRDDYVFIDGNRALYDMNGNVVWYLPDMNGLANPKAIIRDMKITSVGTITFMSDDKAYEINYNGEVLWKAPNTGVVNGENNEHYHHEFQRLANGHYMIMGMESVPWKSKVPVTVDANLPPAMQSRMLQDTGTHKTTFGTIIEYDNSGKVVWSWKSSKYFIGSDLEYYNPAFRMPTTDVHENSFYFDEKNNMIYVNFKGIARIVKVKYPEGNVVRAYGEVYKPGSKEQGNGLFCDEHSCRLSSEGYIYLYNNNACTGEQAIPTVEMLQEPQSDTGTLKKVWEYVCNTAGVNANPNNKVMEQNQKMAVQRNRDLHLQNAFKMHPTSGGHVLEMPDHSMFICMNTEYCKLFIVDRDKKIQWSAVPEKYNQNTKEWRISAQQYRASIISAQDLESLVRKGVKAGS